MRVTFLGTAAGAVIYLVAVLVSGHVVLWTAVAWPVLTVVQSGAALVFWRAWRRTDTAYSTLRRERR